MIYDVLIKFDDKMHARDRREAERHLREDVFEQSGNREYEVVEVTEAPDEEVSDTFSMDDFDVTIHRSLGKDGGHEDRIYQATVKIHMFVEADSVEEARAMGVKGPVEALDRGPHR